MTSNLIFVISMDKLVFSLNESDLKKSYINSNNIYQEIIPYRISFSIIYNKELIYNNDFYINYDLNKILTSKKKLLRTINYNLHNNINYFPIKEKEGKKVIRFINNIDNNPVAIRNFIRSVYFIFFYIKKEIPLWLTTDYNNIKWIINKENNNLVTNTKIFDISVKVIKDFNNSDKYYNSKEINKLLINYSNTAVTNSLNNNDIKYLIDKLEYILVNPY